MINYVPQALTIQESMTIEQAVPMTRPSTVGKAASRPTSPQVEQEVMVTTAPMPQSFQMAAPLNEAELMALLMASPMYQKLEQMKNSVADGTHKSPKHKMEAGQYTEPQRWSSWEKCRSVHTAI